MTFEDAVDATTSTPQTLNHPTNHTNAILALSLIFIIIAVDQIVKIYVKTHFFLGESFEILSWFHIRFIENNGMAFGIELFNKIILTLFRLLAVGALAYYLCNILKRNLNRGYVLCVAALTAGAFGNIIDCLLYGVIFSSSEFPYIAVAFPDDGGYAPLFYGKVVDMLYFPLIDTWLPNWLPIVGGEHFTFFDPVFNIADACICVSIFYGILFERKRLNEELGKKEETSTEETTNQDNQPDVIKTDKETDKGTNKV